MADRDHPRFSWATRANLHSTTDEEKPYPPSPPELGSPTPLLRTPPPPQQAAAAPLGGSPPPQQAAAAPVAGSPPSQQAAPPPRIFNVQLPKEQIFKFPPPDAAARFENRKKPRRCGGCCCRCLCCFFIFIIIIAVLLGVAILVFYLVVKPQAPGYSVNNLSVKSSNLVNQTFSSEFDVTVSANNSNTKIGFYYDTGSSVTISTSNVQLTKGSVPVFYQPTQNVTVFTVVTTGSAPYTNALNAALNPQQTSGLPLVLNITIPARLKLGSVTSPQFMVKVNCNVVISGLINATILSKSCSFKLQG